MSSHWLHCCRYSDFKVNEIAVSGQVVRLTRLEASGDPARPSAFTVAPPAPVAAAPALSGTSAAEPPAQYSAEPVAARQLVAAIDQQKNAKDVSVAAIPVLSETPVVESPVQQGAGLKAAEQPVAAAAHRTSANGAAEGSFASGSNLPAAPDSAELKAAEQPALASSAQWTDGIGAAEGSAANSSDAPAAPAAVAETARPNGAAEGLPAIVGDEPAAEERRMDADLANFEVLAGADNAAVLWQLLADIAALEKKHGRNLHRRAVPQQAALDVTSFDKLQVCSLAHFYRKCYRFSCFSTVREGQKHL